MCKSCFFVSPIDTKRPVRPKEVITPWSNIDTEEERYLLRLLQRHATQQALEESKPEHTEGNTLSVFPKVLSICYQ